MSLLDIIRREIRQTGPMSVARYMELCLAHPEHGYYATRDPLGVAGDFTTAPEISQMFGEMIGVWVLAMRDRIGPVRLVELGPGRGTLMVDILRVMARAGPPPEVWLVETSPSLRAEQARRVPQAYWADSLTEVPEGPMILIANEFFDALPIRQFVIGPEGARERMVGLDATGALAFGLGALVAAADGRRDWDEICPAARAIAAQIAARLTAHRGAALLIDYGFRAADRPPGPTLQAVRKHAYADPLSAPGETDLTWLVDFDRLAADLVPLAASTTTQGVFLARLGIGARAEALARARPDDTDAVADALERLTSPAGMGTLFKVLAAASAGLDTPPGVDDMSDNAADQETE